MCYFCIWFWNCSDIVLFLFFILCHFYIIQFQEAFDILGFSQDEKKSCYKCTASILHMGEMKFKERGEQAEPEGTAEAEKVSFLLGVNSNDFIKCLVKPKIKVGTEVVTQGRNKAQVYSINISLIFYAYVKNCSILSLAIWEKKVLPENLCRLNLEKTK